MFVRGTCPGPYFFIGIAAPPQTFHRDRDPPATDAAVFSELLSKGGHTMPLCSKRAQMAPRWFQANRAVCRPPMPSIPPSIPHPYQRPQFASLPKPGSSPGAAREQLWSSLGAAGVAQEQPRRSQGVAQEQPRSSPGSSPGSSRVAQETPGSSGSSPGSSPGDPREQRE